MIRNEQQYQEALQQLEISRASLSDQQALLRGMGLSPELIERATRALQEYQRQLQEDIAWYERTRGGARDTTREALSSPSPARRESSARG